MILSAEMAKVVAPRVFVLLSTTLPGQVCPPPLMRYNETVAPFGHA
jgi:hypothetical protein